MTTTIKTIAEAFEHIPATHGVYTGDLLVAVIEQNMTTDADWEVNLPDTGAGKTIESFNTEQEAIDWALKNTDTIQAYAAKLEEKTTPRS